MIGRLLTRGESAGVVLIVDSDKLHVDCEGDPPPELIEELRRHKAEVMAALSSPRLKMAEVIIAPAHWVAGAADNYPEPSFEMPCLERRGLLERNISALLRRVRALGHLRLRCDWRKAWPMVLPFASAA